MVHPPGLADTLPPDEHQHHVVHDLGVDPCRHHRHEPPAEALDEILTRLEAALHDHARCLCKDIVITIPGRQTFQVIEEGIEVLHVFRVHLPVDLFALHLLHLFHPPVERVEGMIVVVQPGACALDGIVLQPAVFLTTRDDVPTQFNVMVHPVLDLIEAHHQLLVVRFPLAQALGALQLSRTRARGLQDLHGQKPLRIRIEIRLRIMRERAPLADILPLTERRDLQLSLVVVVTIYEHFLIELTL